MAVLYMNHMVELRNLFIFIDKLHIQLVLNRVLTPDSGTGTNWKSRGLN